MPSKLEVRVSEHDRQIAVIRKLILAGMKMINESQALARENQAQIKALAAAQHETDRMLKGLIRSLERGRNGHNRTDVR